MRSTMPQMFPLLLLLLAELPPSILSTPPGFPPYVPTSQVLAGHKIPHLDKMFILIPNPVFAPKLDYLYSVVRFTGIILFLGWFMVFLFYAVMCMRCCCKCFRCICVRCCPRLCGGVCGGRKASMGSPPSDHAGSSGHNRSPLVLDDELVQRSSNEGRPSIMDTLRNKVVNHNTFRYRLLTFNFFLLFGLIVTAAVIFKGDTGIDAAFAKIVDAVNVIIRVLSLLCSIATSVLQSIADILFQISSPVGECSAFISPTDAAIITQSSQAIQNSMSQIQSLANPVLNALHAFIRAVQAQKQPKLLVYLGYFLTMLCLALLYVVGIVCKSHCIFRLAILLSALTILAITFLASVALTLITVLSDICVDPTGTLLSLFSVDSPAYSDLQYFLFCTGPNPFQSPLDTADAAIQVINATAIQAISAGDFPSICSAALIGDVSVVTASLSEMTGMVECTPIYELYDAVVQGALCTGGVAGIYDTAVVFFATGVLLYLLMLSSSVFYNWYLRPEDIQLRDMDSFPSPTSGRVREVDTDLGGGRSRIDIEVSERGPMHPMHSSGSDQGSLSTYPPLSSGATERKADVRSPFTKSTPSRLLITPSPPHSQVFSSPGTTATASTNPFGNAKDDPVSPEKETHLFAI